MKVGFANNFFPEFDKYNPIILFIVAIVNGTLTVV